MHATPALQQFIDEAVERSRALSDPSDAVLAIAPLMMQLTAHAQDLLQPQHYRSDPEHYARNLIYCAPDNSLSLYALVWLPGQWTPVHDHGSWGVVGVAEGVLEERSFVRQSPDNNRDEGIVLVRGGVVLLPQRAVSTFVPNPDHIHITGVPEYRPRAVSLHLYGRTMSNFNIYDVQAGTRRSIDVSHNES
jgi:3-mercaptopropionate dioxygenase